MLSTTRRHTHDDAIVDQVNRLANTSRNQFPAAFDWLWKKFFRERRLNGNHTLVESLKKHYFTQEDEDRLDSPFRTAPDRLQPGSGSGSQAQESWHRHRLRTAFGKKKLSIWEVLAGMEKLFQSRHRQLCSSRHELHDVPMGRYHEKYLVQGQALEKARDFTAEWTCPETSNKYIVYRAELTNLCRTEACA